MPPVVHVDIHGQRYAIRSDLDPQYIGELATYVDERMRLAAQELATADAAKVAIIAALNIADELFRSRADVSGVHGRITARAMEIERLVDQALGEARQKVASN
jgi:cell division protein ZapA